MSAEYNKGYDAAIRAIEKNIREFSKTIWCIQLIFNGCDIDNYEGETDCLKLLESEILQHG